MKLSKILFAFTLMALVVVGCGKGKKKKAEHKKADKIEVSKENSQDLALHISGMTCEIGCAKTIESKLSKQDGVLDAKVIYSDSIATITYDPAKTNKAALMSFVGGIAESMYTVSEVDYKKSCKANSSCNKGEKSCDKKDGACAEDCKMACCKEKKACDKNKKEACSSKDSKECATKKCAEACKSAEKSCSTSCASDCCV